MRLLGREDEVEALLGATGDVLIVGPAGSGKSRLAAEIPGRRFLTLKAEANDVAESLRLNQPTHVVLDDAGLDLPRLDMLLELRQQGHEFAIVATSWAETADDVRARLPSAVRIDISLLERSEMDKTLKATGSATTTSAAGSWISRREGPAGRSAWQISRRADGSRTFYRGEH